MTQHTTTTRIEGGQLPPADGKDTLVQLHIDGQPVGLPLLTAAEDADTTADQLIKQAKETP